MRRPRIVTFAIAVALTLGGMMATAPAASANYSCGPQACNNPPNGLPVQSTGKPESPPNKPTQFVVYQGHPYRLPSPARVTPNVTPSAGGGQIVAGCAGDNMEAAAWLFGGWAYKENVAYTWCWPSGVPSAIYIYNVHASDSVTANTIWQVNNTAIGDASRAPIYVSDHLGSGGVGYIYAYFQSRNCLLGFFSWTCSTWSWHKMQITLRDDGTSDGVNLY